MANQTGVAQARRAADITLEITGKTQSKFKGGSLRPGRKDLFDLFEASHELISPRDAASGQATGRRQHHPLVVHGETTGGVPQLFQALVTNEVITKAVLNYWRTDASGKQSVYYTIELVNARISELHQFCDEDGRPNFRTALTYDEITVTWKDGNLTATDSWHGVS